MKLFAMCGECQRELGHPSFEPIFTDYYEEAVGYIKCKNGHESAILLQSQKFEILLESAANALAEGYTLEAASSLSSAYERLFEFAINVFCKKGGVESEELVKTFKHVKKQSERQIGAFLFLYLYIFGKAYPFNTDIAAKRNKFIHQGHIPTPEEVAEFGEMVYKEVLEITEIIKENCLDEMNEVVLENLHKRGEAIPKGIPQATTSGTIFFPLPWKKVKIAFKRPFSDTKRPVRESPLRYHI